MLIMDYNNGWVTKKDITFCTSILRFFIKVRYTNYLEFDPNDKVYCNQYNIMHMEMCSVFQSCFCLALLSRYIS